MSTPPPRNGSARSVAQLQQATRTLISEGQAFAAIDFLFQYEGRLPLDLADDILIARSSFIRSQDKHYRHLISHRTFARESARTNDSLLALLEQIPESNRPSDNSPIPPPTCRVVKATRQELILLISEFGQSYDLFFYTDWFGYRFFVRGERQERTRGPWKPNLLSYTKTFDFPIRHDGETIAYSLRLQFSTVTGLLKHYLLVRENTIVLESIVPG